MGSPKRPKSKKPEPAPKPIIADRIEYSDVGMAYVYETASGKRYTFPEQYLSPNERRLLGEGDMTTAQIIADMWPARVEYVNAEGKVPDGV